MTNSPKKSLSKLGIKCPSMRSVFSGTSSASVLSENKRIIGQKHERSCFERNRPNNYTLASEI